MNTNRTQDPAAQTYSSATASLGPVYPVRVSPDRRYFIDQEGRPVFWLGTTQWQLFRDQTFEEAQVVLERSRANGFVFIQVMLAGVGDGTRPNVYGEKPWIGDDLATPNPAYFGNVDAVIHAAAELGLVISLTLYHQRWRKIITEQNARAWSRWLAQRYHGAPNLVWTMTPEARPEFVPLLREIAAGLREGDGGAHLITFKPDPAPYSSSFIHEESWLDFNSMQTWASVELIYPFVTHDYVLEPTKPVLMAEGAYEAGTEYGFDVTPLWVRRQAYYSYLLGGHHTYGHNDSWRMLPTWRQALDAPGAVQMGVLKQTLSSLNEWWGLVPDASILTGGGQAAGKILNLAARHAGGEWAIVYLAEPGAVSIDLRKLAGPASASWSDPRSGEKVLVGDVQPDTHYSTPPGWEDALLIVQSAGGGA